MYLTWGWNYQTKTMIINLDVPSGKVSKSVFQMVLKNSSFWKWKKMSVKILTPKNWPFNFCLQYLKKNYLTSDDV